MLSVFFMVHVKKKELKKLAAACMPVFVVFVGVVTFGVIKRAQLDCYAYYDLGIYAEAALKWSWKNINPWLSARAVYLFCDHFDPVVILMTPWVRLFPLPFGAILFESFVVLLSVMPLIWLYREERLESSGVALLWMLLLFHLGTTTALNFPVHPTTWALTPWVAMIVALELRRFVVMFVSFLFLMACKEEFPFVATCLVPLLYSRGEKKWAMRMGVFAALWLGLVYGLRPIVFGPVEKYAVAPFSGLIENPSRFIAEHLFQPGLIRRLPLFVLPLVPLGVWLWRTTKQAPSKAYLALGTAPLMLRFLSKSWYHHYHAVTAAIFCMAFIPALRKRKPPTFVWVLTVALLVGVNDRILGESLHAFFPKLMAKENSVCPNERSRVASLQKGYAFVRQHLNRRMLVQMNLVPKIVDAEQVFVVPLLESEKARPFELVFFEKAPHGTHWPVSQARIDEAIMKWRQQSDSQVIVDDENVFVALGSFIGF